MKFNLALDITEEDIIRLLKYNDYYIVEGEITDLFPMRTKFAFDDSSGVGEFRIEDRYDNVFQNLVSTKMYDLLITSSSDDYETTIGELKDEIYALRQRVMELEDEFMDIPSDLNERLKDLENG